LKPFLSSNEVEQEVTLKREGTHYYLIIPIVKVKENESLKNSNLKVMSSDPGIVTFQTIYDGERFVEYAPGGEKSNDKEKPRGSIQRIFRLTKKWTNFNPRSTKTKKRNMKTRRKERK